MTRAEIVSIVALAVSVLSLCFTTYFNLRDRARLMATSTFYQPSEDAAKASVSVAIVNAGRRPAIIRMWGGPDEDGAWVGIYLGDAGVGIRLAENERHELSIQKKDLLIQTPDDAIFLTDLWIEDSLGRRMAVKNGKVNVKRLWNS